jgi:D-alanyl-lipoteichoic acid acyltransferase DltB (MBOAT superfamily)
LQDYCLFVLFFPQLIAGPIVHYREMMPQFHRVSCRFNTENVSVGLTLVAFGLFKKVFLADNIALLVTPIYEQAAAGSRIALLPAWIAAVGFTLQIYFDFSGYTDMALGIARLFGVKLPPNFNSPLKASSIIDFWQRWHMTLTRFLTAYIYNPLALWLTRRRAVRVGGGFVGPNKHPAAFIELLMFPVLLTMLVSGIWHGAGYTFILWGVLHGVFLTVNHGWRILGPKLWRDKSNYARLMQPVGFIITFTCVASSMIIFRSASLKTAVDLLQGLAGLHGIGVSGVALKGVALWVGAGAFVAFACPNTLQIMSRYEPALGWKPTGDRFLWQPSLAWAAVVLAILAIGILNLGGRSEFLYWQF